MKITNKTVLESIKSFTSTLVGVAAAIGIVSTQIDSWVEKVQHDLYAGVTKPMYTYVEYDLIKQLEKLSKDPEDLKTSDINKFAYFCDKDSYFVDEYLPQSNNSRLLSIACDRVLDLYDKNYSEAVAARRKKQQVASTNEEYFYDDNTRIESLIKPSTSHN